MRVIVTHTYSGKQIFFEGDAASIYAQIVARYPFLETPDEEFRGDLEALLEDMNSQQAFDAYIEGTEEEFDDEGD